MKHAHTQRGSIIILILMAVALFAALGYALMGNKGATQGGMSVERAKVQASAIVAYMTSLRNATNLMVTGNGCRDSELDFSNSTWVTIGGSATIPTNTSTPASGKCKLFDANGGGQTAKIFDKAVSSAYATTSTLPVAGHGTINAAQVTQAGSSLPEIVYAVGGLDFEVCRQIRKQTGTSLDSSTASQINSDCYSVGTSPTDTSFVPSAGYDLANNTTSVEHKIITGVCPNAGNMFGDVNTCYAAIVLMER